MLPPPCRLSAMLGSSSVADGTSRSTRASNSRPASCTSRTRTPSSERWIRSRLDCGTTTRTVSASVST